MKQLALLLGLYPNPLRTMGRLLDEGSPLFGAVAVLVVCSLFGLAPRPRLTATSPETRAYERGDLYQDKDFDGTSAPTTERPSGPSRAILGILSSGAIGTLVGLAVLYAPTLLLAASLLVPIGGFGAAFRRDFGGLVTCVFFVWAAVHLPLALLSLITPYVVLLRLLGDLLFAIALTPAVRVALGTPLTQSALSVIAGFFGLLLTPLLYFLASPFLIIFAWAFLRGNLSDVEWSLNARRNQRRFLEAATLNPRDAEAHIQLGLIHLRRRQWSEARARFERAVEIEPTDPDARFQLGRLDRLDGRYAEAEKHFIAVMARDPRFSQCEIWREFGGNYLDAKTYEDARSALDKFVSQRPYDPEGLVLLGEALMALGRSDEGQKRFREAVEAADSAPYYQRHAVGPWRKRAASQIRRP